ncbi:transposase [Streptomyces sp. NPDC058239]|uniref:transposase n=1 Tax=unclassified Streptomyces TaxID=2593676 RepID=UPI00365359E5
MGARRVVPPTEVKRPQGGGRRRTGDHEALAAIVFVATSGCTWRQLPPVSGPCRQTVYRRSPSGAGTGPGPGSSERLGRRRWVTERTTSWLTGSQTQPPLRTPTALGLAAALCCYKRLLRLTT